MTRRRPGPIDDLTRATEECREAIRQAHEARRDLRQVLREVQEERAEAKKWVDCQLKDYLKLLQSAVMTTVDLKADEIEKYAREEMERRLDDLQAYIVEALDSHGKQVARLRVTLDEITKDVVDRGFGYQIQIHQPIP